LEYLLFLVPYNLFQGFFLLLVALIWGGTFYSLYRNATIENWEKNWQDCSDGNISELGYEHGSIVDISYAISTNSEKVADIMPGIILIVGLLGTFLGLGISLDSASSILSNSSGSDAILNLMSMLDGLGMKFKTSVWGIIGFLTLKYVLIARNDDSKRLKWCIKKVGIEIKQNRDSYENMEKLKNNGIFSRMDTMDRRFNDIYEEIQQNNILMKQYIFDSESKISKR
jgi:hypothetical protein